MLSHLTFTHFTKYNIYKLDTDSIRCNSLFPLSSVMIVFVCVYCDSTHLVLSSTAVHPHVLPECSETLLVSIHILTMGNSQG